MEWITITRWGVGGTLLLIGAFFAVGNLITLVMLIAYKGSTSFAPLFGGLFGVLGLLIVPIQGRFPWLWVPLVVDWGSFPMFAWVGLTELARLVKKKRDHSEPPAGGD